MNEAVKRIAVSAKVFANDELAKSWENSDFEKNFQKKFSELLINECICIIANRSNTFMQEKNTASCVLDTVIEDIKQHFGI